MRTIGHFCIFVGFFLVLALLLGLLLLLGATVLRSPVVLLLVLPFAVGAYGLYVRGYRAVLGQPGQRLRRLG